MKEAIAVFITSFVLGVFISTFSYADTLGTGKSLRDIKHGNNETMQGVYAISTPSTTTSTQSSVSWDPFASKTNKYSESRLIRVVCHAQGCHIKFGGSSISAAVLSDYYIPVDVPEYFGVDTLYPYVRIIQDAASSSMFVTEIY